MAFCASRRYPELARLLRLDHLESMRSNVARLHGFGCARHMTVVTYGLSIGVSRMKVAVSRVCKPVGVTAQTDAQRSIPQLPLNFVGVRGMTIGASYADGFVPAELVVGPLLVVVLGFPIGPEIVGGG